jgi:hypothetical protein
MRKNFNTINEEINRMKSLFGENRLYGNLVDNNIISEQRKFFSNLTDAFKVTLKSFDQLDTFTKFINREIRDIDDIIKHVDEFKDMWKVVSKNLNTTKLKSNLQKLKTLKDNGNLKNIPEDKMKAALKGFPKEGGMQEMVFDFWLDSKGMSSNLPQKVENRIAKINPSTGELVIGTTNSKGIVSFKNKEGKVVRVEKDPNFKGSDDVNLKSDIEDVEWVDVTEGTTLDGLDGKTIKGSEENINNISDSINESAVGGGVFEQKQKYKTETDLSKEQEIKLKELEIQLQNAKNRESELEIQKQLLDIKNNPEGQSKTVKDGEPETDIIIDNNAIVESESKLKKFLSMPKSVWDRVRILRPKADESGLIRVSKMVGSSIIDPLGLLRSGKIPPIKRIEGVPGDVQKVMLPQNVYWAWGARRIGGLAINGIVWSWYFTVFRGGNPFEFLGYESDPNEYYFPKIYNTYWKNLAKTPFIGAVPKIFIEWGDKQIMELNDNVKKYTGKTLDEWEVGYINSIVPNTKKFLESKSCEELKAMRTEGDNPVLKPESQRIIADKIAEQYHEEMKTEFAKLENHLGHYAKIVEYLTELKLEMPEIMTNLFEDVKTENGESVIEEQFTLAIIEKCTNNIPNIQEGEEDGEESTWYVEGDVSNL